MVSLTYLKAESKQKVFTGQTVSGMWPQDADSSKAQNYMVLNLD